MDFGTRDPLIALPELLPSPPLVQKPLFKVEFFVEIAGPRSVAASQVSPLIQPQWQNALGIPMVWIMRSSDTTWMPYDGSLHGSVDSLGLSWRYLTPSGSLSTASARLLESAAERYAEQVDRRAFALPPVADVDKVVRNLKQVQESLDIGYGLTVALPRAVPEEELWRFFISMGMDLNSSGEFSYRAAGSESTYLTATPLDPPETFSLQGVQQNRQHLLLSIGFNAAISPSPNASFSALVKVIEELEKRFSAKAIDDDGNVFAGKVISQAAENIKAAALSFDAIELHPGSPEALVLFA